MTEITCPKCGGSKKMMGAGYMFHDCGQCNGKGVVKDEIHNSEESNNIVGGIAYGTINETDKGGFISNALPSRKGRPKGSTNKRT